MFNDKEKEYTFNTCWRDGPALLPVSSPADQAIVETTSPGEQIVLGTVPELVLTPTFDLQEETKVTVYLSKLTNI